MKCTFTTVQNGLEDRQGHTGTCFLATGAVPYHWMCALVIINNFCMPVSSGRLRSVQRRVYSTELCTHCKLLSVASKMVPEASFVPRPSKPVLVLQVTNAGVRRPGYEATQKQHERFKNRSCSPPPTLVLCVEAPTNSVRAQATLPSVSAPTLMHEGEKLSTA